MPIFTNDAIKKHVDAVEARDGNTLDVGVESEPGAKPSLTFEAQGGHKRVTWGAWAKTQMTKATTAVGAKLGVRW